MPWYWYVPVAIGLVLVTLIGYLLWYVRDRVDLFLRCVRWLLEAQKAGGSASRLRNPGSAYRPSAAERLHGLLDREIDRGQPPEPFGPEWERDLEADEDLPQVRQDLSDEELWRIEKERENGAPIVEITPEDWQEVARADLEEMRARKRKR